MDDPARARTIYVRTCVWYYNDGTKKQQGRLHGSVVMWMLKYGCHPDNYHRLFDGNTADKRYKQRVERMNEADRYRRRSFVR